MTDRICDTRWHALREIVWGAIRAHDDGKDMYLDAEVDVLADVVMHALDDHLPIQSVNADLLDALRLYVASCGNTAFSVDRELVQTAWRKAQEAISLAEKSNG